jgi:hypothetical protein
MEHVHGLGAEGASVPTAARFAPEEILEAMEVGPRVGRPGEALRAVAFYAANGAAVARPGRLDRILWGMGQVLRAARLVAEDPALRRAALLPTALTFAGCAALAALATADRSGGADPGDAVATFHAFLVAFVAVAAMPPTLLHRMWVRVAVESRRALALGAAEDPWSGVGLARLLWREGRKVLRQAVLVSAGLLPALAMVRLLPWGAAEAAALAAGWAFYWIVVDALELPIEVVPGPPPPAPEPWFVRLLLAAPTPLLWPLRLSGRLAGRLARPWREEVSFTERHPWEAAGFALAAGAVLAIPGVGLFFRSVAIAAATAMHGALEERSGPTGA